MSKNNVNKNMKVGAKSVSDPIGKANAQVAKSNMKKSVSQRSLPSSIHQTPSPRPTNLRSVPVINGAGGTSRKTPSASKINDPVKMEKRLQKVSPWYQSLNDPVHGAGARIPDLVGINTATFQTVQVVTLNTNAAGLNGLLLRSPYVADGSAGQGPICRLTAASIATALNWNGSGGDGPIALAAAATIRSVARAHRVVSACIYAEYEGATLNDQGDVTCFVQPYADLQTVTGVLSQYQSWYGSSVIPVNKARTKPVKSSWYPVSMNDRIYNSFVSPTQGTYGQTDGTVNCWAMGLVHSGLNTSTVVKYTIAINWEFIPQLNTIDYISASPSPIDPIEEQMVEQWVQSDFEVTGFSSNKIVDAAPGSQKTEAASQGMTAESGFGMLGGLIKEFLPVVLTML